MDLYRHLMDINEVTEYLNNKTARVFNTDKTLKFINEKNIPIVFEYKGSVRWNFRAESRWETLHMRVDGYFKLLNDSDAVNIFKGSLKDIDLKDAIIYQLVSHRHNTNVRVPEGIKPKEGDTIFFGLSDSLSTLNIPNQKPIKINNNKVGVLKKDLEEYLNKMGRVNTDNKTKIEALESKIEKLETENARLIQHLNEQADKSVDTSDLLNDRNEKSYQTTIGLLLKLLTVPKVEGDRPPFTSEAVVIGRITDQSIYGQGKTTLETRFRDAKMALEQAKKKAFKP